MEARVSDAAPEKVAARVARALEGDNQIEGAGLSGWFLALRFNPKNRSFNDENRISW
jgi:hypothetical protein